MEERKSLYVVFSSTPYRMGKMIRFVTREPYNHVAIALEEDLSRLYTFARRYYRTPFYGGFVVEEPYRYHHKGSTGQVCLCRLEIPAHRHRDLAEHLVRMEAEAEKYLYNHLSALAATFHKKFPVPNACTCAEFVVGILSRLDCGFSMDKFYSIGDMAEILKPYRVYTGDFPTPANDPGGFFARKPVAHPIRVSVRDILALVKRRKQA